MSNMLELLVGPVKAGRLFDYLRQKYGPLSQADVDAINAVFSDELAAPIVPVPAGSELSAQGIQFIFDWEAQAGVSNRLHFPGGASGVTIGPGYDMKSRRSLEVFNDLVAIGVAREAAEKASKGAGLSKARAKSFCSNNHNLIVLSKAQEIELLKVTVRPYAETVRSKLKVSVTQAQFDMLVSLCYNIGPGNFGGSSLLKLLNMGKTSQAAQQFHSWVYSGTKKIQGLVNRRKAEQTIFLRGKY